MATRYIIEDSDADIVSDDDLGKVIVSDADLVKRTIIGEQEAFRKLMDRYVKLAGAIAFSVVHDYHTSEDIIQKAFLKVYDQLPSITEPERFNAYLARTVKTTALDYIRRNKSKKRGKDIAIVSIEQTFHIKEEAIYTSGVENSELHNKILQEVNNLQQNQREIFFLKHVDGHTYNEIAKILSSTRSAVESQLFRARQILKENLAEYIT